MIVVDASAVVEFLLQTPLGRVEASLFDRTEELHAPHLLDVEVIQALRRLLRTGNVLPARAAEALDDLAARDPSPFALRPSRKSVGTARQLHRL